MLQIIYFDNFLCYCERGTNSNLYLVTLQTTIAFWKHGDNEMIFNDLLLTPSVLCDRWSSCTFPYNFLLLIANRMAISKLFPCMYLSISLVLVKASCCETQSGKEKVELDGKYSCPIIYVRSINRKRHLLDSTGKTEHMFLIITIITSFLIASVIFLNFL